MAVKGETVGGEILCPNCLTVGSLIYRGRLVPRGSRWPGRGGVEDRQTPVPECICAVCKKRLRVLPVEIAPRKTYTRAVIETACVGYVTAEEPTISLQQTVRRMGKSPPHPSTLHGWLSALGARALGRLDRHAMGPPVGALIVESGRGLRKELLWAWTHPHAVSPQKYRSARRREQLEACGRLFATAAQLFPQAAYPWASWERWLQSRFHVTAWGFPARFGCTAIQQHAPRKLTVSSAPSRPKPVGHEGRGAGGESRGKKGQTHDARSPP